MSKKKIFFKSLLVATIFSTGLLGFSNKAFAVDGGEECQYTVCVSGGTEGSHGEISGNQTATISGGISTELKMDYIRDDKGKITGTVATYGGKTVVSCQGECVTVETLKGTIIVNKEYADIYKESSKDTSSSSDGKDAVDETIKEETKKFVPTGTAKYDGGPGTGITVKKDGSSSYSSSTSSSSSAEWACVPVSVETEVTWYYKTESEETETKSSTNSYTVTTKRGEKKPTAPAGGTVTKVKDLAGGGTEWKITTTETKTTTKTVYSDVYEDKLVVNGGNQLADVTTYYGAVDLSQLASVTELTYNSKDNPEILTLDNDGNALKGIVENDIKRWAGEKMNAAMKDATTGKAHVFVKYSESGTSGTSTGSSSSVTIGFGGNGGQAVKEMSSTSFIDQQDCYNTVNKDIVIATEVRLNNKYEELENSGANFEDGCWTYSKNNSKPDGAYNYTPLNSYKTKAMSDIYVAKGISNPSHGFVWSLDDAYDAASGTFARGKVLTSDDIAPTAVEFHTHLVGGKFTGNTTDKLIYRENPSADMYIQNKTNERARYYGKPYYLPLKGTSIKKFNAILANTTPSNPDNFQYVWTNTTSSGNQGVHVAVNAGYAENLSSKENMDMGKNIVTAQAYIDQYYQRLFEIEEYSGLFMTISSSSSKAVTSYASMFGKDQFVYFGNSTGACSKKMLGLTAEYGSGSLDKMYDNGGGNVASATNVSVRSLVNKAGGVNAAISDIVAKRAAIAFNGYHNQGFLLGSENVTITFNNGGKTYSYSSYPSGLKIYETLSGGPSISIGNGSTYETGVYTEVQKKIVEGIVQELDVYPSSDSWETPGDHWEYTICVGEYKCTCADINILCDCPDEEMGCDPNCVGSDCKDKPNPTPTPTGHTTTVTYDCTDYDPGSATAEEKKYCECFEGGTCEGSTWKEGSDCNDPGTADVANCNPSYPGGKTGGGSQDYMDKYYDTNSSITN